jgi:hypothetical protein
VLAGMGWRPDHVAEARAQWTTTLVHVLRT